MHCQICDYSPGVPSLYNLGLSREFSFKVGVHWRPKQKMYLCDICVKTNRRPKALISELELIREQYVKEQSD